MLPQVSAWFEATYGEPSPPQALGWPAIARGDNTLIFAPTGSGKTLAAFLACLDHLWRIPPVRRGIRLLYISPLKALNQDIYLNLQVPLAGIRETAEERGNPLRMLDIGIRTGDTPQADRQKMLRKPPEILITTPESLHLLLTSRAREGLRSVSHVIVDEIHALCSNKRGVFLSLLLERLEHLTPTGFVRIGLSATQRPLEEVARYLGGQRKVVYASGQSTFQPRPVTIADAGRRKDLDLEVTAPFRSASPLAAGTVWPAIETMLVDLIRTHRSTIVFTNNRRVSERLTAHLNEIETSSREDEGDVEEKPAFARAHHGSLNLSERRETEEALKRGELAAVVSTASLELGIDMGAVDLVCQVESPGSVARGLQRVGRAGHVVGRTSKGRLIAKTCSDLLETAALSRAMLAGEVETLRVPTNCLDVLAQQVVACVAAEPWDAPALYDLIRGSYSYRNLPAAAFESVLMMISGRFPVGSFQDLRARVSWDRVHNRLYALPGTARLALAGGGTIPDTGQYPVYLGEGGPKLGELDEEFVFERRVGETFAFGSAAWRIEAIEPLKVIVSRAEGQSAMTPFWRGEDAPRTAELGEKVGLLCREISERPGVEWLHHECRLDASAANALRDFIARQKRIAGAAPDDHTVIVEAFRDPSGDLGLAVLTPFGGKLHQALKLALQGRLRERLGVSVACMHADDGLLIRVPRTEEPPLDLLDGIAFEAAEAAIRAELGESALFGLRFRQNAGRALLLPKPDPTKRTPNWLQRLRAKDLLQVVGKFPDFPIVVETYRECLEDDIDLPRLRAFLNGIRDGTIRVVKRDGEVASPFAQELIFRFTQGFLYEWDQPKRPDRDKRSPDVSQLLDSLIEPNAVARVDARLRGVGLAPRTTDEMAEALRTRGDLASNELEGPMLDFLNQLRNEGRAELITIGTSVDAERWIAMEDRDLYARAFASPSDDEAAESIARRYIRTHALVGFKELMKRYPIGAARATEWLERWADEGQVVRIGEGEEARWAEPANLDQVRRMSIALRRKEVVPVTPEVFADSLLSRQGLQAETMREGKEGVIAVLELLQGFAATLETWESEILPRRVKGFLSRWLDDVMASGAWVWRAKADGQGEPKVAFVTREFAGAWLAESTENVISADAQLVLDALTTAGALFVTDLARITGLEPSRVYSALEELVRGGEVTNDRLDPLRPEWKSRISGLHAARQARPGSPRPRIGARRLAGVAPEGRWSRVIGGTAGEGSLLAWADVLLERYGVLSRETVGLDSWAPAWREILPLLSLSELRGELRRGYFVEGLSGIQFATEDAADELTRIAAAGPSRQPVLVSTLDPANLYGSGAPFDIPLLEGGTARLNRGASNLLVLIMGRPVLIIEGHGKRLTGLGSASETELRAALGLLASLANSARRVLKVESFNTAPALASPVAPWLIEVGFVRDHPGLAYYAGW